MATHTTNLILSEEDIKTIIRYFDPIQTKQYASDVEIKIESIIPLLQPEAGGWSLKISYEENLSIKNPVFGEVKTSDIIPNKQALEDAFNQAKEEAKGIYDPSSDVYKKHFEDGYNGGKEEL